MENVLITGSSGFIGKNLRDRLEGSYTIKDFNLHQGLNITNPNNFDGLEAKVVIHLAAVTRSNDIQNMLQTNVNGTLNVLEFCKRNKAKIIFASTAAVYGNAVPPIKEECEPNPISFYGVTKVIGEGLCKFYHRVFGLDATVVRMFNPYGPGQKKGLLVYDLLEKINRGETIHLSNPFSVRDFIYIDDVTDAIARSISLDGLNTINIGTGEGNSVEYVARVLSGRNVVLEDEKGAESQSIADISKARELLGWEPTVSLEEGLIRVITK